MHGSGTGCRFAAASAVALLLLAGCARNGPAVRPASGPASSGQADGAASARSIPGVQRTVGSPGVSEGSRGTPGGGGGN